MSKIQVLVVDDSAVIRKVILTVLSEDPDVDVTATAPNGQIALQKISQQHFDLVTLDVEMPVMNGLETLAEIRKNRPSLPVIMFSTLTERGACTTLDALSLGASDYMTKPSGMGNMSEGMQNIREELLPKIKALCYKNLIPKAEANLRLGPEQRQQPFPKSKIEVLGIGVSTGGPNALTEIIPKLPKDLRVPVLIVQHMPPLFTKFFSERLSKKSQLPVSEAVQGTPLEPGHVWIAPGGFHMSIEKAGGTYNIQTHQGPPENSCRPSVDVLFRSLARHYGSHALVTILTGMGQDGLYGCKEIYEAGGEIYVQDKTTSVVWGMPGAVVNAGIARKILPLEQIPAEWLRRIA